jgi:hypothetical protein
MGVVVLVIYTGFTIAIFHSSKAADAAMHANVIATNYLIQTEKANVTVGKPDGVAAEFVMPNDPRQKAQLMVYFQNSGRSPAKFNWGKSIVHDRHAPRRLSGSIVGSPEGKTPSALEHGEAVLR